MISGINEKLVEVYQNGNTYAIDELVKRNEKIVFKIANKFYVERSNSIDKDDMIQEGFLGLLAAANKYRFDIKHPVKFITYAVYWIYQKMNRFIRYRNTNEECSLNMPIGDSLEDGELMDTIQDDIDCIGDLEERLYIKQLHEELDQVMDKHLTLKEREILKLKFGWDKQESMSHEEIGEIFNNTPSQIGGIAERSYGKMRRTRWGQIQGQEYYEQIASSLSVIDSIDFRDKYLVG